MAQTREHLFRHCSRWMDIQTELWEVVGRATGWKAGRCQHVQISELFSIEECNEAVMDFLVATEVRKFPPKSRRSAMERAQGLRLRSGIGGNGVIPFSLFLSFFLLFCLSFIFHLSFVSGDEG